MDADAKFNEKVLSLIAEAIPGRFRKTKITPELSLQRDLGIDSLGIAAFVFRLEDAFGVEIGDLVVDIDVGQMRTVGDALKASKQIVTRARAGLTS
ncbi:phosphopantetheine-binding protein [Corallococcus llansteffanensis]|uniref:Acyl carrier protein n=1 Tax=Corallococcus llansteffanensis TaxID=2316731 RepID=A0A3A8PIR7_9BACT|nr:phosphopantetheine-binding protein [Corallococcus llansteffanensis]RKH56233.1 acyl carrier protein [Corallococcus llansteffanensis]